MIKTSACMCQMIFKHVFRRFKWSKLIKFKTELQGAQKLKSFRLKYYIITQHIYGILSYITTFCWLHDLSSVMVNYNSCLSNLQDHVHHSAPGPHGGSPGGAEMEHILILSPSKHQVCQEKEGAEVTGSGHSGISSAINPGDTIRQQNNSPRDVTVVGNQDTSHTIAWPGQAHGLASEGHLSMDLCE